MRLFHIFFTSFTLIRKAFYSTSPKQYLISTHEDTTQTVKAKGTKRNLIKKNIKEKDFINVTIKNQPSKTLKQHFIKRCGTSLFVYSQNKRVLSCFTSKRLFIKKYFTDSDAFSFPLHLKKHLLQTDIQWIHSYPKYFKYCLI